MKQFLTIVISLLLFCGYVSAQELGIPGLDYNVNASPQVIQESTSDEILTTLTWTALAPSTHAVSRSCVTYFSMGGNDYIYQFGGGSGTQYTTVVRYECCICSNNW